MPAKLSALELMCDWHQLPRTVVVAVKLAEISFLPHLSSWALGYVGCAEDGAQALQHMKVLEADHALVYETYYAAIAAHPVTTKSCFICGKAWDTHDLKPF